MKKSFFLGLTIFLLCNINLLSQGLQLNSLSLKEDRELNPHPHQIGIESAFNINARNFLRISYRKLLPNNQVFRASSSGFRNLSSLFDQSDDDLAYFEIGLGYEKHFPIAKKLSAYVGGRLGVFIIESSVRDRTYSIEALAGLKYNINKRLSVFAEARYGLHLQRSFYPNFERMSSFLQPNIHVGVLYTINKYKRKK